MFCEFQISVWIDAVMKHVSAEARFFLWVPFAPKAAERILSRGLKIQTLFIFYLL
jgi:hypothetical protein